MKKLFLFLFFLIIFSVAVSADSTQILFTTNSTFTVPSGVNYLQELQMIGGGGSGDVGGVAEYGYCGGAGGFSGTYLDLTNVPVIAGYTYNIGIGTGGVANRGNGIDTLAFGKDAPGGPSGYTTVTYNSGYITSCISNHSVTGDNGFESVQIATNGGGYSAGAGGVGYGASGGGGGAVYYSPYNGGNGAYGAVLVTYDPSSNSVFISGYVLSAQTGLPVSGATVSESQLGNQYSSTSGADGSYSFSNAMVSGFPITLATSASGYNSTSLVFTSQQSNVLAINQTLMLTSPSISGISYSATILSVPYNQPVNGATFHIVNSTSSLSATSNVAGYASVNGLLANGAYLIFATQGTANSTVTNVTAPANSSSMGQATILIGTPYTLILYVKDYSTSNPIALANVTDETGNKLTSYGSGAFTGTYLYGSHTFTATAPNYYQNSQTYTISSNATETITLQGLATNSSSTSIQYTTPHDVRFHVKGVFSGPISGVNITASYVQQSSSQSWLTAWIGVLTNPTINVQQVALFGNTGTDGTVDFLMVPSIQYLVTDTSDGQTMLIYPTDDDYTFWSGGMSASAIEPSQACGNPLEAIQMSVVGITVSSTSGIINVTYNDTQSTTSAVNIFVNQTYNYGNITNQTTLFYSQITGENSFTATFNVTNPADQSYTVAVSGISANCGIVTRAFGVTFPPNPINLGIPYDLLPLAGFGLILFVGLLFTRDYPGETVIIIMMLGWITFFMHWYDSQVNPVIMVSALSGWSFIAIVYNIMLRSKKPPVG